MADKKFDPNDDPFRQHESVAGFSGTPDEGKAPVKDDRAPKDAVSSPAGWIQPTEVSGREAQK